MQSLLGCVGTLSLHDLDGLGDTLELFCLLLFLILLFFHLDSEKGFLSSGLEGLVSAGTAVCPHNEPIVIRFSVSVLETL